MFIINFFIIKIIYIEIIREFLLFLNCLLIFKLIFALIKFYVFIDEHNTTSKIRKYIYLLYALKVSYVHFIFYEGDFEYEEHT